MTIFLSYGQTKQESFSFYDLSVSALMQSDFLFISNDGGVGQSSK